MVEDIDCEMRMRDEVDADLTKELVNRLRDIIDAQRTEELFRERLVTILTRYELYRIAKAQVTRNERRNQISRLSDKAQGFLGALDALHPEVLRIVKNRLDAVTSDTRWEEWSFESGEPIPEDDRSTENAKTAVGSILAACQMELDLLEETKGTKKGSGNPALDQLLIDLAGLFETETNLLATSNCYRDPNVEEEYNGKFFHMAKVVLDEFARGGYDTPAALGIRILRLF